MSTNGATTGSAGTMTGSGAFGGGGTMSATGAGGSAPGSTVSSVTAGSTAASSVTSGSSSTSTGGAGSTTTSSSSGGGQCVENNGVGCNGIPCCDTSVGCSYGICCQWAGDACTTDDQCCETDGMVCKGGTAAAQTCCLVQGTDCSESFMDKCCPGLTCKYLGAYMCQ